MSNTHLSYPGSCAGPPAGREDSQVPPGGWPARPWRPVRTGSGRGEAVHRVVNRRSSNELGSSLCQRTLPADFCTAIHDYYHITCTLLPLAELAHTYRLGISPEVLASNEISARIILAGPFSVAGSHCVCTRDHMEHVVRTPHCVAPECRRNVPCLSGLDTRTGAWLLGDRPATPCQGGGHAPGRPGPEAVATSSEPDTEPDLLKDGRPTATRRTSEVVGLARLAQAYGLNFGGVKPRELRRSRSMASPATVPASRAGC